MRSIRFARMPRWRWNPETKTNTVRMFFSSETISTMWGKASAIFANGCGDKLVFIRPPQKNRRGHPPTWRRIAAFPAILSVQRLSQERPRAATLLQASLKRWQQAWVSAPTSALTPASIVPRFSPATLGAGVPAGSDLFRRRLSHGWLSDHSAKKGPLA